MGIILVNNEQAKRMAKICMLADVAWAFWGATGVGKTTLGREIAVETHHEYIEFALSVVDAADIGGFPDASGARVIYKPLDLLPFGNLAQVLLVLDEFDRGEPDRIAAAMKIILRDPILGHILSPNMRIGITGNGATDTGTAVLPDAAKTRACHIYIGGAVRGGLESYLEWAEINGMSPVVRAFAKHNEEVWNGNEFTKPEDRPEMVELGMPSRRGWDNAGKIITVAEALQANGVMKVNDIMLPLLTGVVGELSGQRLHVFWTDHELVPTLEEVLADPRGAKLPPDGRPDIRWSFSVSLAEAAGKADSVLEAREMSEAIAEYGLRFPAESGQFLFNRLMAKQPEVVQTAAWAKWNAAQQKNGTPVVLPAPAPTPVRNVATNHYAPTVMAPVPADQTPAPVPPSFRPVAVAPYSRPAPTANRNLHVAIANILHGTVRPDGELWQNRVSFHGRPHPPENPLGTEYLFSQNKATGALGCDCRGYINNKERPKRCAHIDMVREELAKLGFTI